MVRGNRLLRSTNLIVSLHQDSVAIRGHHQVLNLLMPLLFRRLVLALLLELSWKGLVSLFQRLQVWWKDIFLCAVRDWRWGQKVANFLHVKDRGRGQG